MTVTILNFGNWWEKFAGDRKVDEDTHVFSKICVQNNRFEDLSSEKFLKCNRDFCTALPTMIVTRRCF